MPPTKKGYQNASGVSSQTDEGIFYVNGRYLCQRIENDTRCNREIAATRHSISSHNSDFHTPGRYRQLMARGDYKCNHDGCNHQSENFQAILAHNRSSHKFKGSSDPLKRHYGIPVGTRNPKRIRDKKPRQKTLPAVKEDDREETHEDAREELKENCDKKSGQESEDDRDHDDNSLDLIDPRLRKWDKDNGNSGNGGAGSGGSSLGGQLLSSNVIAASG